MKKTLAILLAAATTMSAGVTGYAQEQNVRTVANEEVGVLAAAVPEAQTPVAEPNGFELGADKENDGATLQNTILEPGTEYKFPVNLRIGTQTVPMTEENMKDYKINITKLSKTGVKTFKIEEYKGAYYLNVEIRDSVPTEAIEIKYNVKLARKSSNLTVFSQEVKFQYGYEEHNSDYINGLEKGETIEIDNNNPVITKKQFEKIAKINDYRNVMLSGPSWTFQVNVTDEETKNMVSSSAGIKEILAKMPEQEFKFYNFTGKPGFHAAGQLALDVEDIAEEWDAMYAYRFANDRIYKLKAQYNEEDNTLEFRTNRLDCFFVTDKPIEDGYTVVLGSTVNGKPGSNQNNIQNTSSNTSKPNKVNPSTGASDRMMIEGAVAAAMAALALGGIAASKKLKK